MIDPVASFLDSLKPVLTVVNEILNARIEEGCLQVPDLLCAVAAKLNWDDTQVRAYDSTIRLHLKNHPVWNITRGAYGGIVRRADQAKKVASATAKRQAKAEIEAVIEAVLNVKGSTI